MITATVAVGFVFTLCWLALRANTRFRDEDQLPMQWLLPDTVTAYAPRIFALFLLPALGALVLGLEAVAALLLEPKPGQEGLVLPVQIATGILFLAIQHVHFWMIERSR